MASGIPPSVCCVISPRYSAALVLFLTRSAVPSNSHNHSRATSVSDDPYSRQEAFTAAPYHTGPFPTGLPVAVPVQFNPMATQYLVAPLSPVSSYAYPQVRRSQHWSTRMFSRPCYPLKQLPTLVASLANRNGPIVGSFCLFPDGWQSRRQHARVVGGPILAIPAVIHRQCAALSD